MDTAISKLIFSAHTWPLKRWGLTIIAAERSVGCEILNENGKIKTAGHRCDSDEWTKLESLLAKCNFSAWREKYEKPVLDGTSWHLEIQFSDGRTMESDGMNDYPDEARFHGDVQILRGDFRN